MSQFVANCKWWKYISTRPTITHSANTTFYVSSYDTSYIFLCVYSIIHFSSIEHQVIRLSKWSMDFELGAEVKK